jgi:hypothetical protein
MTDYEGQAPRDIVARTAPDPEALAAMEQMIGKEVTITIPEWTDDGVSEIQVNALFFSMNGNRNKPAAFNPPPDSAA